MTFSTIWFDSAESEMSKTTERKKDIKSTSGNRTHKSVNGELLADKSLKKSLNSAKWISPDYTASKSISLSGLHSEMR